MGNFPAAKREWVTALMLAPGSEYVLHNLGLVANSEKHYPQARAFFFAALRIRPNFSDAHLDLGITYQAMGLLDQAEAQFLKAERLSPLNIRVHNTLSEFYLDRRKLPESEAEARRSVEIQPTTQGEWDLGLAEWMQDNRSGAERAFVDALALNPSSSRAHFMLGLFYMDSSRNAEAIREYRAGLQLDPSNADAIVNLKKLEFLEEGH
jgi:Flp pilus assembly protein TadD